MNSALRPSRPTFKRQLAFRLAVFVGLLWLVDLVGFTWAADPEAGLAVLIAIACVAVVLPALVAELAGTRPALSSIGVLSAGQPEPAREPQPQRARRRRRRGRILRPEPCPNCGHVAGHGRRQPRIRLVSPPPTSSPTQSPAPPPSQRRSLAALIAASLPGAVPAAPRRAPRIIGRH